MYKVLQKRRTSQTRVQLEFEYRINTKYWTRTYDPNKYPFLTQQICSSGPTFCAATVLWKKSGGFVVVEGYVKNSSGRQGPFSSAPVVLSTEVIVPFFFSSAETPG